MEQPSEFKTDIASNIMAFAYYYATPKDLLRIGIKIAEDFNSETCIGEYLRDSVTESVRINDDECKKYGRKFWTKCGSKKNATIRMKGHGGKRIIIQPETKRVLVIHAMRNDYDLSRVFKSIFKNKK